MLNKQIQLNTKVQSKSIIVDTVASTVQTTVDSTKNATATAFDKGTTLIGGVKGIIFIIRKFILMNAISYIFLYKSNIYVFQYLRTYSFVSKLFDLIYL